MLKGFSFYGEMAMKQRLEIGKIVATHGIRGEVRVQPWADSPADLQKIKRFYLDSSSDKIIEAASFKVKKNLAILKIKGCDSIEQAEKLKNQLLYIDRDDLPLPDGSYFVQDILGSAVYDADEPEKCYGEVTDITHHGGSDVYHLKDSSGKLRMFPAIREVLIRIDIPKKEIYIRPLRGLFDED